MDGRIPYRLFRGYRIPSCASEENFAAAADHRPAPGDAVIVSYPKCGTTWLQHIVYLLKRRGLPATSIREVVRAVPFVEQDGWPHQLSLALKSHLPLRLMAPLSEGARYLYIARNPKDACVSYYHFLRNLPGYCIESFDAFFAAFAVGELPYGDFFDHVAAWASAARHQPDVFFLTYESLHADTGRWVAAIADFLDVRLDADTLASVLEHSSFESMRRLSQRDDFLRGYLRASTGGGVGAVLEDKEPVMMRRGEVGDWRRHLSAEQNGKLDRLLRERAADMPMDEWKEALLN